MPYPEGSHGKTTFAYRIRQYPTHKAYLIYAGEEIFLGPEWEFLLSTTGVRVDWHRLDNAWRLYLAYEGEGRDYVGTWSDQRVWMIGKDITAFAGLRAHIKGAFYLSTELGMQRESMGYANSQSQEVLKYETKFSPWAKLAIETWIDKVKIDNL